MYYIIENTTSGHVLGVYEAGSESAAIEEMLEDGGGLPDWQYPEEELEVTKLSIADIANMIARGHLYHLGYDIYCDRKAGDVGVAYRFGSESGELGLDGWQYTDGSDANDEGYELDCYFSDDNRYIGPDHCGICPRFRA